MFRYFKVSLTCPCPACTVTVPCSAIEDAVVGATDCGVVDFNSLGYFRSGCYGSVCDCFFFTHVQTGPGAHPASCTMGTKSFPGVKRLGSGADHPPLPSAEVENA
jgi:hypothetical protein